MTVPPSPDDFGLTQQDLRRAKLVSDVQNVLQKYTPYLFRTGLPLATMLILLAGGFSELGSRHGLGLVPALFGGGLVLDQLLGRGILAPFFGSACFRTLLMNPKLVRYEASVNAARAKLKENETREARKRQAEEKRRRREEHERRQREEAERRRQAEADEQRRREAEESERRRQEEAQRLAEQKAQAEAERERREQEKRRRQAELDRVRRKEVWLKMDGYQFEDAVANLFEEAGWQVERRGKSGDNGVDLTVKHKGSELRTIVQCKAHRSRLSKDTLRAMQGVREDFEYAPAIIACLYGPTKGGMDYANRKGIQVFDVDALVDFARSLNL